MSAMLKELAEIETRFDEATVEDVRRTANLLLRRQFLFLGDRGSGHAYETLTGPKFRPYFSALFDALGYSLRNSDAEQWVGLLPDAQADWFPRLRLEHTLVLLVLALVWQEEVNRGGAEARAVVTTTLNAIFERYRDLTTRGRKESLTTARFEEALREFERRSLVRVSPPDSDENDRQIEIRPMVHVLVDGNALDLLDRFAGDVEAMTSEASHDTDGADERSGADDGEDMPT